MVAVGGPRPPSSSKQTAPAVVGTIAAASARLVLPLDPPPTPGRGEAARPPPGPGLRFNSPFGPGRERGRGGLIAK